MACRRSLRLGYALRQATTAICHRWLADTRAGPVWKYGVIASVTHLFRKHRRRSAMQVTECLNLVSRFGIASDANAHEASPRQVLLVSSDTLSNLSVAPGALRENVVLSSPDVQGLGAGSRLRVGEAILRISFPCDPCHLLQKDSGLSPSEARGRRGMLATVVRGGEVKVGDGARVIAGPDLDGLPPNARDRVGWLVSRIPSGYCATFGDLARAAGLPPGAARSLPQALQRRVDVPHHRVVVSDSRRIPVEQMERLTAEGIGNPAARRWRWLDVIYGPSSEVSA